MPTRRPTRSAAATDATFAALGRLSRFTRRPPAPRLRRVADAILRSGAAALGALTAGAAAFAVMGLLGQPPTQAAEADTPSLAQGERAAILSLGPWPPSRAAPDTRNPASGRREGIALGEALFHSARLSDTGSVRCASCHEPWRRFTDGRPLALGVATGTRNTPTLLDAAAHRRFGWDGANDDLAQQSLRPLRDPREMPASAAHVAALLRDDPDLRTRVAAVFGAQPQGDDDTLMRDAGLALAAYVETLASARTPFDAWRDAFAAGDTSTSASFPPAALRGLRVFVGRGGCVACHAGPSFGDDDFHVSLIHSPGPDGQPDRGRAGDPPGTFRTPGLREAAATAPYMHDGSAATLCDALRPHALPADGAAPPAPLTAADSRDLVAFLQTLATGPAPPSCTVR
jgi:cytochrome c peroxidase